MSYLRASYPLKYVEGISHDYIYRTTSGKKRKRQFIQDYGNISNEGLVELVAEFLKEETERNAVINNYLIRKLAGKLDVKLRKKPLTRNQLIGLIFPKFKRKNSKAKTVELK